MDMDPRRALDHLIEAFEQHLEISMRGDEETSDELLQSEERLSDAFFTYDDILFTQLGVELPFDILDEDDDLFDDDEDEDEDHDDDEDDIFDIEF